MRRALLCLLFGCLAGCTVDPSAALQAADLELTFVNASDEAARVDVTLTVFDRDATTRQASLLDRGATLYFFDLPEAELDLAVVVRTVEGDGLQCFALSLVHSNKRQSITLDVAEVAEPCGEAPECEEEPCDDDESEREDGDEGA